MIKNLIIALFLSSIMIGCGNNKENVNIADAVYINGKIYTVNKNNPWAEAVAVKNGKVVFVGSSDDVQSFIGETTITTEKL